MKEKKNQATENQVDEIVVEEVATENVDATIEDQSDKELPEKVELTQEEFNKVKAHIESIQKEKDEAINLAQRLQADFDNYRKRNANLKKDSYDEGMRDCIRTMLPTLDNFDRALENVKDVDDAYVEGMKLVYRTLMDTLSKLGLKQIEADGAFDENLHNAVIREAVEGKETGAILEVLQKGYEVSDKILRYSMVKVAE